MATTTPNALAELRARFAYLCKAEPDSPEVQEVAQALDALEADLESTDTQSL